MWSVKLSLREQLLFVLNCFVIVLWALFIYGEPYTPLREHGTEIYVSRIASEKQRQSNNVAAGENDFGGFGQVRIAGIDLMEYS